MFWLDDIFCDFLIGDIQKVYHYIQTSVHQAIKIVNFVPFSQMTFAIFINRKDAALTTKLWLNAWSTRVLLVIVYIIIIKFLGTYILVCIVRAHYLLYYKVQPKRTVFIPSHYEV